MGARYSRRRAALLAAAAAVALGTGAGQAAAQITAADVIFAVDESGSMSGEQTFLGGSFIESVDQQLKGRGITPRYGLVGFGSGGAGDLGRSFLLDGGLFGDVTQFQAATGQLLTSGFFEDGYSAIDFIFDTYTFDPLATKTIVLVTDEDRDVGNASLTFGSVLSELNRRGIALVGILDARFQDNQGRTAIATDGEEALVFDNGQVVIAPFSRVTGGFGTTEEDYVLLSLGTPDGCVADLNFLRQGGAEAQAFADVFGRCLIAAIEAPNSPPGGQVPVLVNVPSHVARSIQRQHRRATRTFLSVGMGSPIVQEALSKANLNTKMVEDVFGADGLRAYVLVDYVNGEVGAFGTNSGIGYDGVGTVFGVDYTLDGSVYGGTPGETLTVGGSIGYQSVNGSVPGQGASLDAGAYSGQLYAMVQMPKGPYLLGTASYTHSDFDQRRQAGGAIVTASPSGKVMSSEIEGGFQFPELRPIFGTDAAAVQVTPFAGMQLVYEEVNGFTDSAGVRFGSVDDLSLVGRLGIRSTVSYELAPETELFTQIELAGAFDFLSDDDTVLVTVGGITRPTVVSAADDAALELRLVAGAKVQDFITAFVQYSGDFSEHVREHGVAGGLVINF